METGLQISDEETKEQLGLVHKRQRLIPEDLHLHLVSPPASVYSPHRLILWPSYALLYKAQFIATFQQFA